MNIELVALLLSRPLDHLSFLSECKRCRQFSKLPPSSEDSGGEEEGGAYYNFTEISPKYTSLSAVVVVEEEEEFH